MAIPQVGQGPVKLTTEQMQQKYADANGRKSALTGACGSVYDFYANGKSRVEIFDASKHYYISTACRLFTGITVLPMLAAFFFAGVANIIGLVARAEKGSYTDTLNQSIVALRARTDGIKIDPKLEPAKIKALKNAQEDSLTKAIEKVKAYSNQTADLMFKDALLEDFPELIKLSIENAKLDDRLPNAADRQLFLQIHVPEMRKRAAKEIFSRIQTAQNNPGTAVTLFGEKYDTIDQLVSAIETATSRGLPVGSPTLEDMIKKLSDETTQADREQLKGNVERAFNQYRNAPANDPVNTPYVAALRAKAAELKKARDDLNNTFGGLDFYIQGERNNRMTNVFLPLLNGAANLIGGSTQAELNAGANALNKVSSYAEVEALCAKALVALENRYNEARRRDILANNGALPANMSNEEKEFVAYKTVMTYALNLLDQLDNHPSVQFGANLPLLAKARANVKELNDKFNQMSQVGGQVLAVNYFAAVGKLIGANVTPVAPYSAQDFNKQVQTSNHHSTGVVEGVRAGFAAQPAFHALVGAPAAAAPAAANPPAAGGVNPPAAGGNPQQQAVTHQQQEELTHQQLL